MAFNQYRPVKFPHPKSNFLRNNSLFNSHLLTIDVSTKVKENDIAENRDFRWSQEFPSL